MTHMSMHTIVGYLLPVVLWTSTIYNVKQLTMCIIKYIIKQLTIGAETMLHEHKVFPLVKNSSLWVIFQIFSIFKRRVEAMSCAVHLFLILHVRPSPFTVSTSYSCIIVYSTLLVFLLMCTVGGTMFCM